MTHWFASSVIGVVLTGRFRPICAAVALAPECWGKRVFSRAMDRAFCEPGHARRVWMTYQIGRALR